MKKFTLGLSLMMVGCGGAGADESVAFVGHGVVAGAGYTTFDAATGGCEDSPNGINCNNYSSRDAVYMSGGPSTGAGLSDGEYYFSVLTPGSQNGGFVEGARGNLSDQTAGGTVGDDGTGDALENRTFTVHGGQISAYGGTHAWGTSPNGRAILQLKPYDLTDNPGGVYILAICQVGAASPSQCKYDAFRVAPGQQVRFGTVAGGKYYDRNANGLWDLGEVGLANWPIEYTDGFSGLLYTDAFGAFDLSLIADAYTFSEQVASSPWRQTGNRESQLDISGTATGTLNADMTYQIALTDNSTVDGVYFGNLCVGRGGGKTLGFWSNKNGQALIASDDLALLRLLPLVNASGAAFDPADYRSFRTWILNATAVNMAYMLSAQLAAMELNVHNGLVGDGALIYAPGVEGSNVNGFATVADVVSEAILALTAAPLTVDASAMRTRQEAIKNALDAANNDTSFVQASPETCPAPLFPTP